MSEGLLHNNGYDTSLCAPWKEIAERWLLEEEIIDKAGKLTVCIDHFSNDLELFQWQLCTL